MKNLAWTMIFILASASIVEASILEPSGNPKYCAALTASYPGPLPEKIGISNNYKENYQSDFDNYMHNYAIYITALSSQAVVSEKAAKTLHDEVLPPFLTGCICRSYAAIFSFIAGVMPPMPMLGRSLL
jgi:hypothetical protein